MSLMYSGHYQDKYLNKQDSIRFNYIKANTPIGVSFFTGTEVFRDE